MTVDPTALCVRAWIKASGRTAPKLTYASFNKLRAVG